MSIQFFSISTPDHDVVLWDKYAWMFKHWKITLKCGESLCVHTAIRMVYRNVHHLKHIYTSIRMVYRIMAGGQDSKWFHFMYFDFLWYLRQTYVPGRVYVGICRFRFMLVPYYSIIITGHGTYPVLILNGMYWYIHTGLDSRWKSFLVLSNLDKDEAGISWVIYHLICSLQIFQ